MTFPEISTLLHSVNPYNGFNADDYPDDVAGWGSEEPFFAEAVTRALKRTSSPIIVEVGTWKGASAIHIARLLDKANVGGGIVCVDTWLGALEFWTDTRDETRYGSLKLKHGYPTVYYQFLANVVRAGVANRIVPFPVTSPIAARWCAARGVRPNLVYIDASHDEPDVMADLAAWWPVVQGSGVLFGHDYEWVRPAVDRFAAEHRLRVETAASGSHWAFHE